MSLLFDLHSGLFWNFEPARPRVQRACLPTEIYSRNIPPPPEHDYAGKSKKSKKVIGNVR